MRTHADMFARAAFEQRPRSANLSTKIDRSAHFASPESCDDYAGVTFCALQGASASHKNDSFAVVRQRPSARYLGFASALAQSSKTRSRPASSTLGAQACLVGPALAAEVRHLELALGLGDELWALL